MVYHKTSSVSNDHAQLMGKTDQRFVENSFKLFRDCLGIRTVLTASQFLGQVGDRGAEGDQQYRGAHKGFVHACDALCLTSPSGSYHQGFAERKILLICEVISACKKIHNDEIRKERLAALKSRGVSCIWMLGGDDQGHRGQYSFLYYSTLHLSIHPF